MWQALSNHPPLWLYLWNLTIAALMLSALGLLAARILYRERLLQLHRVLCFVILLLLVSPLVLWSATVLDFGAIWIPVNNRDVGESKANAVLEAPRAVSQTSDVENRETLHADAIAARIEVPSPKAADDGWAPRIARFVAAIWIAGGLLVAFRWGCGLLVCRKIRNRARTPQDRRLISLTARACDAVQLDQRVSVSVSSSTSSPLVVGVWRPLIVLPEGLAETLSDEELLCVLTHEAAHVARHDTAIAWLQLLSTCVFWWNPLLRTIHRMVNRAREQICDDYVIRARGTGDTFAAVLVKLAEWSLDHPHGARPAPAMLLHEGNDVTDRIIRLTEGDNRMNLRLNRTAAGTLFVLIGLMLAFTFVPALRAQTTTRRDGSESNASPVHLAAFQKEKKSEFKNSTPEKLSYNDGTPEGKKSIAGASELISFTLPADGAKVAAVRIHGSRYGYPQAPKEDFSISFLNQDLSKSIATKTAPYSRFKRGEDSWVEVKFSEPVEVPKDFWVGVDFNAEQTKGVYVSIDKSTDGSHSRVGSPGKTREANVGGDWMIEVVLAK